MSDLDEPEQEALFEIEGPDEDACVWIHSTDPRNPWTQNLGVRDKVAEVLSQWLGSMLRAMLPEHGGGRCVPEGERG